VVALSRQPSLELLHRCSPRGGLLVRLRLPRCFLAANIGKSARHLGALSPTHGGPRQHRCVGCSLAGLPDCRETRPIHTDAASTGRNSIGHQLA
jgi:hypothetical protein